MIGARGLSRGRRFLFTLIISPFLLLASCGDDSPDAEGGGAKQVEVTAADFAFDTTSISAEPGESIELTLVNSDDAEHSFTIEDVVDLEAEGGEEGSATFTAPEETVQFFCRYHPDQMQGELTISGSSSESGAGDTGESDGDAMKRDYDY